MKLSLVIVTAALVCLEGCWGAYWNQSPQGLRRPASRAGRDRPRPLRHNRHVSPHHGFPHHRPPPNRMHRPPGHRRSSRPLPPFRHFQNHIQPIPLMSQPIIPNAIHHHLERHPQPPPVRQEVQMHPFFQQDEIVPEQSKHYPVTVTLNPTTQQTSSPGFHHSAKELQAHGYLSSTYKGWKPIVKPYQDSFLGPISAASHSQKNFGGNDHPNNIMHSSHSHAYNLDTLFRENTEHMKGHSLKPAYSENQGVRVPPPPSVKQVKAIDVPIWNKRLPPPPGPGQSSQNHNGGGPGIPHVVPPRLFNRPKLLPKQSPIQSIQNHNNNNGPSTSSGEESNHGDGPKFPKFKLRQRPLPQRGGQGQGFPPSNKDIPSEPQPSNNNNGPSVLPPFPKKVVIPTSEETGGSDQTSLNLKAKLKTRGRVRVRTSTTTPDPNSQSAEEVNNNPPRVSRPLPQRPSPQQGQSNNAVNSIFEQSAGGGRKPSERDEYNFGPPPIPQGQGSSSEEANGFNSRPSSFDRPIAPPLHRGLIRQHAGNQRAPKPPAFTEKFPGGEPSQFPSGPSESSESVGNNPPQRVRKKRPKTGSPKKDIGEGKGESSAESEPQQPPPSFQENPSFFQDESYFPPGFHSEPGKNTRQHPVSFMTMPGTKPQVIHHSHNPHRPQQQLYPINAVRSPPEFHGQGNLNGNYGPSNRPHFATINVHNGPSQHHGHNVPPPRYHQQHQHQGHQQHHPGFSNNDPFHHFPAGPVSFGPSQGGPPHSHSFGGPSHHHGPPPPPSHRPGRPHHGPHIPAAQHSAPVHRPPPPSSTTMRYPHHQSSPPPFPSSTYSSVEMSDSSERNTPFAHQSSPFPSSTSPRTPFRSSPPPHFPPGPDRSNMYHPAYSEYAPSYANIEFEKIPMQFMEHLKPILREEPSSTPRQHQSPDIHPPSSFFDDFFNPFENSFNPNPDQELDAKPSLNQMENQGPPFGSKFNDFNNNDGNFNAEQSSPQPQYLSRPAIIRERGSSSTPRSQPSSSVRPIRPSTTFLDQETTSPKNDDFIASDSSATPVWSKLQDNDIVTEINQEEIIESKLGNKIHHKMDAESPSSTPKSKVKKVHPHYQGIDRRTEKIPPVTTYKPSFAQILDDIPKIQQSESNKDQEKDEDDMIESNTPVKNLRFPSRIRSESSEIIRQTPTTTTTQVPETTTLRPGRRHFRRRRPDAAVRRRFFSSRVKVSEEEDKEGSRTNSRLNKSTPGSAEDGYEREPSPSASHFKSRRLLARRKNLSVEDENVDPTTPPHPSTSSAEAAAVTYGESQWFRIKPTGSSELEPEKGRNVPELLPLESSSETTSTEAVGPSSTPSNLRMSFSSKKSVSYVDGRFPVHKKTKTKSSS